MEKTLEKLKDLILDYTDEYNQLSADIADIERQLKLYEHGNLELRPGTWFMKARKAYFIKKKQRLETNRELTRLRLEFKLENIRAHNTRTAAECSLYYHKLEEVMDPYAFKVFMEDTQRTLDADSALIVEEPEEIQTDEEEEDGESIL